MSEHCVCPSYKGPRWCHACLKLDSHGERATKGGDKRLADLAAAVCWAYLGPVSKAINAQGEVAARSIVGLDELRIAVEDASAVLVLREAGMAPAVVRSKAIVSSIPRLCTKSAEH